MPGADFKLTLDPADKLHYEGPFDEPKVAHLKITNPDDVRLAFKVKCTDNSLFKIRPVVGILDKDGSIDVSISLNVPDGKLPKKPQGVFVSHMPAGDGKAARRVWDEAKGNEPVKKLLAEIKEKKEEGGEEKKEDNVDEKKEEQKEEEKNEEKEEKKEEEGEKEKEEEA